MAGSDDAVYFDSPAAFGKWLRANHAKRTEVVVGYHRVATGVPSLTWPESVAEALCWGWIDGIRRRVDETRYTIRFTPRKATSNWSAVNVRMIEGLIAEGRVQPPGLAAYARRVDARTGIYGYEQRELASLDAALERTFRANRTAWTWWTEQATPAYRKMMTWRVVSAKRPETRAKRLAELIAHCEAGLRLDRIARER